MLFLLKFVQKLVSALNSEGTPGQVALGIALGSAFGLTPLLNLHNVAVLAAVALFNISFPGAMLGWVLFAPVGYLLDPVFDQVGTSLLTSVPDLVPTWTTLYNIPVVPLSKYNNTVVLGSLIGWLVLVTPIFFFARWSVRKYRERLYERFRQTKVAKAVRASKVFNVYKVFRP